MTCPHCQNDDMSLIEHKTATVMLCAVCSKEFPKVYSRRERLSRTERHQAAADAGFDTWEDYRGEK